MYEEEKEEKKKRRFKLFDSQREGKGITKEEALLPPGLKKFFILYKRDFSRLLSVNILMVLGNFPALFLILALSGLVSNELAYPSNDAFGVFAGLVEIEGYSAPLLALNGILGTDKDAVLERFLTQMPTRFSVAKGMVEAQGVIFDVDDSGARVRNVKRIQF